MFSQRTSWRRDPNRLARALEARNERGAEVLDLTESNPTRCGLAPSPDRVLRALSNRQALEYHPDPRGAKAARVSISAYYAERGAEVSPEDIFLTTSTSEAYAYLFRLLADPGDEILVPQPSYPLFDFLAGLNDCATLPYPLVYDGRWQADLGAFEVRMMPHAKAAVVVHPNNPTGSFLQPSELARLAERCAAGDCALIADEVFSDYAFESTQPALRTLTGASSALTFTLSGLSKICALPQMKLGWIVASGPEAERNEAVARLEVIADTYLSVSAAVSGALPEWLELRRDVQPRIRARVRANLASLDLALAASPAVTRLSAQGGWYAILKLPAIRSDEDWAVGLLERQGVYVHPGHFFEMPWESHLVVSLLPEEGTFREAIRRLFDEVRRAMSEDSSLHGE